ncbi:phage portal protein [Collinsella ihumii]|uniref:phage portal protein n=1 Tax=Collinsella ihumii TaxID=1720204 RepID=UPI0025AB0ABF|nr:phage portal protein [Collinsella ihumii]MDN0056481.1 phage portal protein [Collinsella ihumii]
MHKHSTHTALRACRDWRPLLLNDKTQAVCDCQEFTDWLATYLAETGFMPAEQATVMCAFGMGMCAWALWVDADASRVRIRHYDARMVAPLTWDKEGVAKCAFVTGAFYQVRAVNQLQMHLRGDSGYRIETACFDRRGNEVEPVGACPAYATDSELPTFALVKPAIDNTRVDMGPYGQSVFADAIDAIQAVDLAFDAMISEVDNGKMRVFLSDVMFDQEEDGRGRKVSIPFGRQDCTVFRKAMSTEDTIREFAPQLRTDAQAKALRMALQMLGDLCGFGISYFDFDGAGYVKTATEVSSDNSALMRNIRRHEHVLEKAVVGICRAAMAASRSLGVSLPDEGDVRVSFDDSIITDTAAEKRQDTAEVAAGLMLPNEYRRKWFGESDDNSR